MTVVRRPPREKIDPPPQKSALWPPPKTKRFDLGMLTGAKRPSIVIGIDQSATAPAIAALSLDDLTAYIWVCNPLTKGAQRLYDIEEFTHHTLTQLKLRCSTVEHVCMEGYSFGSQNGRELAGEVGGTVKRTLLRVFGRTNKVAYPTIVSPDSLKKFTVGHANSPKNPVKKQQMMMATLKRWGVEITDDNACDAYDLTRVARAVHTGATEHAYEQEVVARLEPHTEWPAEQQ